MTDVDVIVLDLDGGEMLQRCVDSVAAQVFPAARIIVFDNGSSDPVGRRLQREPSARIEVVHSSVNLGFAGGVNAAMQHVRSPYVALVNNDVVLDPYWLLAVTRAMDADDTLAAVQTIIRRDENTIDGAGIDISDGTFRQAAHGAPITTEVRAPWGLSATATLYRRAATGDVLFDERFFAYYEDVALCARLLDDDWTFALITDPMATHAGSKTASRLGRRAHYLRTRNRYWVARMFPGVGNIPSLIFEDFKLMLRGKASWSGIRDGLKAKL